MSEEFSHTADKAAPDGGHNHEQQVDVAQTAKQDDGQQDGDDDDDTTHRGHTNLLHAERVYAPTKHPTDNNVSFILVESAFLNKGANNPAKDAKG